MHDVFIVKNLSGKFIEKHIEEIRYGYLEKLKKLDSPRCAYQPQNPMNIYNGMPDYYSPFGDIQTYIKLQELKNKD